VSFEEKMKTPIPMPGRAYRPPWGDRERRERERDAGGGRARRLFASGKERAGRAGVLKPKVVSKAIPLETPASVKESINALMV